MYEVLACTCTVVSTCNLTNMYFRCVIDTFVIFRVHYCIAPQPHLSDMQALTFLTLEHIQCTYLTDRHVEKTPATTHKNYSREPCLQTSIQYAVRNTTLPRIITMEVVIGISLGTKIEHTITLQCRYVMSTLDSNPQVQNTSFTRSCRATNNNIGSLL